MITAIFMTHMLINFKFKHWINDIKFLEIKIYNNNLFKKCNIQIK